MNLTRALIKNCICLFLLIALGSCSLKVVNFVNNESSFAQYKTFGIANYKTNNAALAAEGMILFNNIEKSISEQMTRREYQKFDSNPDVLIRYEIIANRVTDTQINNNITSTYNYYNPLPTTRTFTEAALLLEMIDLKTKKLVWQASVDLSQYEKKSQQSEIIKKAVSALYDTYLYKAGSNKPDESLKEAK
ncbi:MAG: DUF4136 domain-containing protein [Cyclobacteriaceae bacterium]